MNLECPIPLTNFYQNYEWGTADEIPALFHLSRPASAPLAEYWIGAHPNLPSEAQLPEAAPEKLNALISRFPEDILGPRHDRMSDTLPYLFKLLSAARSLSVQVHPTKKQAEAGFARENDEGIELTAAHRNYKDPNHKPEIMLAFTPFSAMVGFRDSAALSALLKELEIPSLQPWAERLENQGDGALKDLYTWVLGMDEATTEKVVSETLAACDGVDSLEAGWVKKLHSLHGTDAGILFPLILNLFVLQPGEAVYLDAGVPHAYLEGTGIEVMASSDNVLRGGLTPKHIDRAELTRITVFKSNTALVQKPEADNGVTRFNVPCPDFQLEIIDLKDRAFVVGESQSAELFFLLEGSMDVMGQTFEQGDSFLLPAKAGQAEMQGNARVCRVYTRF